MSYILNKKMGTHDGNTLLSGRCCFKRCKAKVSNQSSLFCPCHDHMVKENLSCQ